MIIFTLNQQMVSQYLHIWGDFKLVKSREIDEQFSSGAGVGKY